jgi:predicted SAM-dependent methyltransferase
MEKTFHENIKIYLQSHDCKKLQVGCSGNVIEGWFNCDIQPFYPGAYYLDATKNFPIDSEAFDYVFSEHMIEHITYSQGVFMLKECFRILKRGGKIRICTPDLKVLANLYTPSKSQEQAQYIRSVVDRWLNDISLYNEAFVINQIFGFGHRFVYDYDVLKLTLEDLGFINVNSFSPGESNDSNLANIDVHAKDYIRFETLVVQAEKPLK